MVFMAAFQNNLSAAFRDPHRFDPDRFAPPREEHLTKNAYVPQGAGETSGHKCAGYDLSTVFMQLFTAILVTDYTWELPVQDRSLSYASIPPEPKSGLLVRLQRKRS
jgi:cytochrome P450